MSKYTDIGASILNQEEKYQEAVLKESIEKAEAKVWEKVKDSDITLSHISTGSSLDVYLKL